MGGPPLIPKQSIRAGAELRSLLDPHANTVALHVDMGVFGFMPKESTALRTLLAKIYQVRAALEASASGVRGGRGREGGGVKSRCGFQQCAAVRQDKGVFPRVVGAIAAPAAVFSNSPLGGARSPRNPF